MALALQPKPFSNSSATLTPPTEHFLRSFLSPLQYGSRGYSVKYSPEGQSGTLASPFGYTGQLYIAALDLYYYKARMYSPRIGRFLQPDPSRYAGGMNLYSYANNDPVNFGDPWGLKSCVTVTTLDDNGREVQDVIAGCDADIPWPYTPAPSLPGPVLSPPNLDLSSISAPTFLLTPQGDQDKQQCTDSSRPSSIVTVTATTNLGGLGAEIGGVSGPIGAVVGYALLSQIGVGVNVSYVPATKSYYAGPTAVLAPLQINGGSGISASYTPVPAGQNANAIANGTAYSASFQPLPFLGAVATKSPGSGPAVVGFQVGTRSPVSFSASHNFCVRGCGC